MAACQPVKVRVGWIRVRCSAEPSAGPAAQTHCVRRASAMAEEFVDVGTHLRLVAFGIECLTGVGVLHRQVERALEDANRDQVSAKHYVFLDAGGITVTGDVDEFEPETIRISVRGHAELERNLSRIVESARICALRIDGDRFDV